MVLTNGQRKLIDTIAARCGVFTGNAGFAAIKWLREFTRIIDVYEMPALVLPVFKLCMGNAAATWLSKLDENIQDDYALLRPAFLARFVPPKFQDELEPVLKRHQAKDENVQSFAEYFVEVLQQIEDAPSERKLCKLFESQLLPAIQSRLSVRNWDNLDELITEAKLVETKLYLPLLNSEKPITTQLTEQLVHRHTDEPAATYQQALRDVQNTQSNPRKLHQDAMSTIEDAKQIKDEMLAVLKNFKQEMRSNLIEVAQMQFGQTDFPVQQQPFPFPNRGRQSNSTLQFEKANPPIFNPQKYTPNMDCYRCGKRGHKIADCREKWCVNHQVFGHSTQECRLTKFCDIHQQHGHNTNECSQRFRSSRIPRIQQTAAGNGYGKHKRKVHFTPDPPYQRQGPHFPVVNNIEMKNSNDHESASNVSPKLSESSSVPRKINTSNCYTAMQILECLDKNGDVIDILGDTGCSNACMDLDFAITHQLPVQECTAHIKMGNSSIATAMGKAQYTFLHKDSEYTFQYYIVNNLRHSLILGTHEMNLRQAYISFPQVLST